MNGLAAFVTAHGLKQQQIADAIDMSVAHVSFILAGDRQPSKQTIDALLAYCRTIDPEITYEALFGAANGAESAA